MNKSGSFVAEPSDNPFSPPVNQSSSKKDAVAKNESVNLSNSFVKGRSSFDKNLGTIQEGRSGLKN